MTVLDVVLLAVISTCAIYGARQGFIRELSHVVAFGVGIFLAVKLHSTAAALLFYRLSSTTASVAAFLGLFLVVIGAVYVAFSYVKSCADKLKFKSADHAAGALLGGFQGAFICALIIFALVNFSSSLPKPYLQRSRVASFLLDRSTIVWNRLPYECPAKFIQFFGKQTGRLSETSGKAREETEQETPPAHKHPVQSRPAPTAGHPLSTISSRPRN